MKGIMTPDPSCCTPDEALIEAAKLMKECDCGAIPVVEDRANRKPVGIITDRDIVIRALAEEKDPLDTAVEESMTRSLVTVTPEDDVQECVRRMEQNPIRRILVVVGQGNPRDDQLEKPGADLDPGHAAGAGKTQEDEGHRVAHVVRGQVTSWGMARTAKAGNPIKVHLGTVSAPGWKNCGMVFSGRGTSWNPPNPISLNLRGQEPSLSPGRQVPVKKSQPGLRHKDYFALRPGPDCSRQAGLGAKPK